jgi:hypothetical protein
VKAVDRCGINLDAGMPLWRKTFSTPRRAIRADRAVAAPFAQRITGLGQEAVLSISTLIRPFCQQRCASLAARYGIG